MIALKTLSVIFTVEMMKDRNAEAKLINRHIQQKDASNFAMHRTAEREQTASFVRF